MKTKNLFFYFGFLFLSIFFYSCEKETSNKEQNGIITKDEAQSSSLSMSEMLLTLEKSGINLSEVVIKKNYFVIEGDIVIKFESLPEIRDSLNSIENSSNLKAYHYPNPYYATLQAVSDVKVYLNPSVASNNWSSAAESAINNWNNISSYCAIHITIVTNESSANIVIGTYYENSNTVALGAACINGQVGGTVNINTNYNSLSELTKINTITHELGHNLGFAHSNGTSSFSSPLLITNTSSQDNSNAVMYYLAHSWTGFISDEILAARTLYPKPIVTISVLITGPTKGYNNIYYTWRTTVSGGTAPYTYDWEYSYNGADFFSLSKTTSSITQQLPLDSDLFLKVTVTDSNGISGGQEFGIINLDTMLP